MARFHLVVLSNFNDIPFTFAPGIRKRFQSSPNALETCCFATPKPGRGFPLKENRAGYWFIAGYCSGTLAAAS